MGERRERVVKDHVQRPMDKAKGEKDGGWEVGIGGTGENGDNCT